MTEIELYQPRAEVAIPAANDLDSWTAVVQDIIKFANVVYDTPFVPEGLRGSAAACAAAMLTGREMGLGIMTSLNNFDVIKGKPTQKALLMRAMIQSRGHKWQDVDVTDTRAVVKGCRKGESEWTEVAFTADQAKRAGIDLGKYPADKLYARATSRLARRKFADVIMGMPYTSEEAEDGDLMEDGDLPVIGAAPAAAIEPPKARTAQRAKARQAADRPTGAGPAPASAAASASAAPAPGQTAPPGGLPPLPGEDEDPTTSGASSSARAPGSGSQPRTEGRSPSTSDGSESSPDDLDYDSPGTVTNRQLTAIWTSLSQTYHFGPDEKDQARGVCAQILNIQLASSKELSHNQARTVIDTLAHWKAQAEQQDEEPRGYLMLMLQTAGGERDDAAE